MLYSKILNYFKNWDEPEATQMKAVIGGAVVVILGCLAVLELCFFYYVFC